MKTRKLMSIMTAAIMAASVIPTTAVNVFAADDNNAGLTQTNIDKDYYEAQLNAQEQAIYNALDTMSQTGLFINGKGSLDLLKNGISKEEAQAYINGDKTLAQSFQNARDAYMADHPALFYLDSTKLVLRAGVKNGAPALEISNGTNANYYEAGFTSASQVNNAIKTYNTGLNGIVSLAKKQNLITDQIRNVHNQIVNKANYANTGNYIKGGYGVFVGTKVNCQGYAKLFKDAMDQLGIETILVNGTAVNAKNEVESHMWNYVKVDGQWYGVDVTWDDPIGGRLRDKYLLAGTNVIGKDHFPINNMSEGAKENELPTLSGIGYGEETITDLNEKGFTILTERGVDAQGYEFTKFKVSYDGKATSALEAEGKVLAMRYAQDGENYAEWTPTSAYSQDSKDGTYTSFIISKAGSLQFAITELPYPKVPKYAVDLSEDQYNIGLSEGVKIEYIDNYVPEPALRYANPAVSATIKPVEQKINVQMSEAMELIDPDQPVTIEVVNSEENLVYEVKDIAWSNGQASLWDGEKVDVTDINFTFTPDTTYQGNENVYTFRVKNLRGVESQKEAREFRYRTSMDVTAPCLIYNYGKLFAVAGTTKLGDEMVDLNNFKGTGISGSTNVILVAEKNGEVASFDLGLGCTALLKYIKPGTNMMLGVPYPKGYDANTTYKAYYFVKDAKGNYTAKELTTQISEKGLEVVASPL